MANYCSKCGKELEGQPNVCPHCGESLVWKTEPQSTTSASAQPVIVNIENNNTNANVNAGRNGKEKNKWVALILWFFLGGIGGHKFYEGKIGMGILYFLTGALFGIGWIIDFWVLLFKPTTYYV